MGITLKQNTRPKQSSMPTLSIISFRTRPPAWHQHYLLLLLPPLHPLYYPAPVAAAVVSVVAALLQHPWHSQIDSTALRRRKIHCRPAANKKQISTNSPGSGRMRRTRETRGRTAIILSKFRLSLLMYWRTDSMPYLLIELVLANWMVEWYRMEGKRGGQRTRAISRTSSARWDSNSDLGLLFEDANADILYSFLVYLWEIVIFGCVLVLTRRLACCTRMVN